MDINNDLQQINTFVKGMNTDVSDALMDSSQYRYAENVRLTTNTDENTGEIRLIEGSEFYSQIPEKYGTIVAMTSIRNLLIAITKKLMQGKHIEYVNGNTVTTLITKDGNYILVYNTETKSGWKEIFETLITDEPFGSHLSLVTRWESDNNIKLYIADGIHSLMYINIASGKSTLVKGIDNIASETNISLDPITNVTIGQDGHIKYTKVQYTYRLYKIGGATTRNAPLSKVITLYKSSSLGYGLDDEYTKNSVTLRIPSVSGYKYIQIFRIGYTSVADQPEVNTIYDGNFISTFKDVGNSVLSLSNSEFLNMYNADLRPTVIESKGDYLFAANIKDIQQDIDEELDADMSAYSSGNTKKGSTEYLWNQQFDNISLYNEQYWKDPKDSSVVGGSGKYVTWRFTNSYIHIDSENNRYSSYSDFPNNPIINPNLNDTQTLRPGEVYRYGAVLYNTSGKKTSVRWIADIMVPPQYEAPQYITTDSSDRRLFKLKRYGIRFDINWSALKQDYPLCSKVEIVRAEKTVDDTISLFLGICGYPVLIIQRYMADEDNYADTSTWLFFKKNVICPTGMFSVNRFFIYGDMHDKYDVYSSYWNQYGVTDSNYLMFASPEYSYADEESKSILDSNKKSIYIQLDYSVASYMDQYVDTLNPQLELVKMHPTKNDHTFLFSRRNILNSIYEGVSNGYYYEWDIVPAIRMDVSLSQQNQFFANPNEPLLVRVSVSNPDTTVISNLVNINSEISAVGYSQSQKPDSLFNEKTFTGSDAISTIPGDSYVFVNWSIPTLYENAAGNTELYDDLLREYYDGAFTTYPIGSIGRCIILKTALASLQYDNQDRRIITPIISIKRKNILPYNGDSTLSVLNYLSFGNVLTETNNHLETYEGDCFPGVFIYNSSHTFNEPNLGSAIGFSNIYSVPIYSEIDLSATSGSLYTRVKDNKKYYLQDKADSINGYVQSSDMYLYKTEYGINPNALLYSAIFYTDIDNSKFDTRVFHSELKTNNERIDKWLTFLSLNYIDVDSRFGLITNMRLFKDKLLFWLEHATGILSVNDRTVVNDVDDNEIIIGSGGILPRFDYISTVYGMKPYLYEAEVLSNNTQYWWDGYNKEILAYTGGMELVPLTKIKGLTNYINEYSESTKPVLAYDVKYDEVLNHVVGENTLVYNEQIQAFSSVYTFMPQHRAIAENNLYLTESNKVYTWNKQQVDNHSLLFNKPAFPKVRIVINKNNIYTKTFDNLTFGGRMYKGSLPTIIKWPMERVDGEYMKEEHLNSPMHHLTFTFETPLKQMAMVRGDEAVSVDEYDYRLAIPRNASNMLVTKIHGVLAYEQTEKRKPILYGNRMRGKTMQCEIASDYNSTDFSLQYITTKYRMSWG